MIKPGLYRVSGRYTSTKVGVVEVLEVTEQNVMCKKQDGQIVSLSRDIAEALRWTPIDQGAAYGNDCPNGRCEA